ncbi:S2-RNase [Pyrus ussuriensis x Pyrus communis]|uniref:S2-RNase n=1 Tax=Pyrus ussuriensis x Pyrus communis TaxID=2448454 RepID=A0A5N5IAG3_9ROSA|nr:S2-RNase [Pyrus ussuriensis x Pyrus communis]
MEPEMSINDLVEVKQYEHKSIEDFMMRFKRTRMRCQFLINHAQLISIAQKALRLLLRKKFYDIQFKKLQELVIVATKYEKLLLEEQQVKHSSKVPLFYKSKAAIHQVEFEGVEPEQNDGHGREGMDMCAVEMTTPFKPLIVKGLVQPVKDQNVVMNDGGFIPMKPPKYQSYSFDLTMASEIYEELVWARVIRKEGKKYCKLHYTFNHSITNCVKFRDWIQDLIVKGKLMLEKPQANMMIDTDPFPEAEKGKGKATWEVKVERRQVDRPIERTIKLPKKPKSVICECKLEVPTSGAIIDQELIRRKEKKDQEACRSIMRAAEKETSGNGLSKVFRNYEASEEVEDGEAKIPKWVDMRPP